MQEANQFLINLVNQQYQKYKKVFDNQLDNIAINLKKLEVELVKVGTLDERTTIKDTRLPTKAEMTRPVYSGQKAQKITTHQRLALYYTEQFKHKELQIENLEEINRYLSFLEVHVKDLIEESKGGTSTTFIEKASVYLSELKIDVKKAKLSTVADDENKFQGDLTQYLIERYKLDLRREQNTNEVVIQKNFQEYVDDIEYIVAHRTELKKTISLTEEIRKKEQKAITKNIEQLEDTLKKTITHSGLWSEIQKRAYCEFLIDMNLEDHLFNQKSYLRLGIKPSKEDATKQYKLEVEQIYLRVIKNALREVESINKTYRSLLRSVKKYYSFWDKASLFIHNVFSGDNIDLFGYKDNGTKVNLNIQGVIDKNEIQENTWEYSIKEIKKLDSIKALPIKEKLVLDYFARIYKIEDQAAEILIDLSYKDFEGHSKVNIDQDLKRRIVNSEKRLDRMKRKLNSASLDYHSAVDYAD